MYNRIWRRLQGVPLDPDNRPNLQRVERNNPPYAYMTDNAILQNSVRTPSHNLTHSHAQRGLRLHDRQRYLAVQGENTLTQPHTHTHTHTHTHMSSSVRALGSQAW